MDSGHSSGEVRRSWDQECSAAGTICLFGFCCCLLRFDPSDCSSSSPGHTNSALVRCLGKWSYGHDLSPPHGTAQQWQRAWDTLKVSVTVNTLFEAASDDKSRARLLAASSKESGAWLHAFPVSSLGLRMDSNTVCVAVGLRLGAAICHPHTCCHCGLGQPPGHPWS